jgi:circadian clock protein KaiC
MILSRDGITLAEVYSAGGEVLMGTARWEKEEEGRQRAARTAGEAEERSRLLLQAEAETRGRIAALEAELGGLARQREVAEAAVQAALGGRALSAQGISEHRRRAEDGPVHPDPFVPSAG